MIVYKNGTPTSPVAGPARGPKPRGDFALYKMQDTTGRMRMILIPEVL
jgi:hypothetical protein